LLRDPGHCFEYVNPAYQSLFPGRQLVGQVVSEAVPEMPAQGLGVLDRVYQTGKTLWVRGMLFAAQFAPGQEPRAAYYDFTYQAYRENGQVVGISIFAHDVTEQVHLRAGRFGARRQLPVRDAARLHGRANYRFATGL
jgi:hypothetical protein